MSVVDMLGNLTGIWQGENRLRLSPGEPDRISATEANITLAANGQIVAMRYTWKYEKRPQEGLLLIGQSDQEHGVQVSWVDSWHMQDRIMHCQGFELPECGISVIGSYTVPEGPAWGWRIVIIPEGRNLLDLIMYNVTPQGEEQLAVEARYNPQLVT